MSHSESNSLRRALAKGAEAGGHPDADALNAFAEGALIARERRAMLDHLAACAECRELLAVAADGIAEQPARLRARGRWATLRVLVPTLAAAAAVLAVSTLVVRSNLERNRQHATMAEKRGEALSATPLPEPQKPAEQQRQMARNSLQARPAAAPVPPPAPQRAMTPVSGHQATETVQVETAEQAPVPAPTVGISSGAVGSAKAPATSEGLKPSSVSPAPRSMETNKAAAGAQVSAFANTVTSEALARAPATASGARPHWRINSQGQPERAFGGGPWQPLLPNATAKMRVLSVFAGEVWVGGEKSQVFRSFDNGETWRVVSLPSKNGLEHTIVHIRFSSAREIGIEASDGTVWTSWDGGETWK